MKYYGEALYHFVLSESLYTEFSSSEILVPIVKQAKKMDEHASKISMSELNCEISEVRFPVDLIPTLKLSEIQQLRMLEPFLNLRNYLARYRGGYEIKVQRVIDLLEGCEPVLLEFLSKNRYRREQYYYVKRKEYMRPAISTMYDAAQASTPIVLSLMYPGAIPLTVASFFALGFFAAKKAFIDIPTNTNLATSTTFDTAINTVNGNFRNIT